VDNAFDPTAWRDWFVATAGIGAALAGLVFVAFSINLREILRFGGVVERGAESLIMLLSVAVTAIVGLWPADPTWVGLGLVAVGVAAWATAVAIFVRSGTLERSTRGQKAARVTLAQVATLSVALAGASLVAGIGPGLDLLIVGTLAAIAAGVSGAWVLLVEILR
jgi:modulator of FtsH protease